MKGGSASHKDVRVGNTIAKIVSDFLKEKGKSTVLLYHCDHTDGKQTGRNKIIDDWYDSAREKDLAVKQTVMIETIGRNGNTIELFMGYITLADNPHINEIRNEFQQFAERLTDK